MYNYNLGNDSVLMIKNSWMKSCIVKSKTVPYVVFPKLKRKLKTAFNIVKVKLVDRWKYILQC